MYIGSVTSYRGLERCVEALPICRAYISRRSAHATMSLSASFCGSPPQREKSYRPSAMKAAVLSLCKIFPELLLLPADQVARGCFSAVTDETEPCAIASAIGKLFSKRAEYCASSVTLDGVVKRCGWKSQEAQLFAFYARCISI